MSQPDLHNLPVMESFYTLQGEGCHAGRAAYFIRLGGCDVGCVWCDVKESWEAEKHPLFSVTDIADKAVEESAGRLAVITGGEPLMYDLSALTQNLKDKGFELNIETAGVYPITGEWDWICFSPKKFKQPLPEYFEKSHELKVVIFNKKDFEWAESLAEQMHKDAALFLQVEWSKKDELLPLVIDYVKEHPKWRISLQTHKYMDIP